MNPTRPPSHLHSPTKVLPSTSPVLSEEKKRRKRTKAFPSIHGHNDKSDFSRYESKYIIFLHSVQKQEYDFIAVAMLRIRVVKALETVLTLENCPQMVSIRARDIRNEWSRLDMGPEGPDRYLNTRNVLRGWKHGAYLDIENYIKSRDRDGLERYVGEQFKKALLPHKTPSGETNELTVDQKSRIEWIVSHYETIRNTSKAEEDQFYKLPSQAEEVGTFQSLEQDRRHRQPYSGHPSSPSSRDGQPSPPSRTLARVPQYKQSSRPAPYPNHRTEDYHPPPSTASSRHVTPPSVGFNHSYVRDTSSNIPYYPPPSSNKPDLPFRLQLPPLSSITQFLDPSYQSQFPPRYPSTKFATSNPAQYPNAGPSRSSEYPPLPPAPGYYPTQATLSYLQPQATSSYLQPQPTSSYLQQQNASIYLQPHASRSSDGANPPPPERARAPLHSP